MFEGLAYAIVDSLQGYPQGGELYLTGGGAASATWLQMIADCTGRTVVSSPFNELSARGAAILAARSVDALSRYPALEQTRYRPNPQAHSPLRCALSGLPPAARADAPGVAGPPRGASTYFSGITHMKIVFTAEHAGDLSAFQQLGELRVEGWALGKPKLSAGQLIELAHDAEVLVTSYDEVTEAVIAACPRLQVIACTRANPVNIDTKAAQARGIRVLYTPGRNADAAAELTLGLMLSLARHIPQSHAALKRGEFTHAENAAQATQSGLRRDVVWDVSPQSPYEVFKGSELRNKTLGLIGYGNIGRRVARIARAFGMAVLVVDPFVAAEDINEPGLQKTTLEGLFREADIVSLHLSSGPHSDGLVNAQLLNSMKPGALLINTSRAAVVDEEALIHALRHGPLGGAALDVYHREPLWRDHPFVTEFDNVIITPHIAGATRESIAKHTAMIAADLQRYVAGEPLLYQWR
ncbi:putative D-3-phosphoglycerate dehydrogenase [Klebsiella grimontii]|nr:putative D-3-phosphoglycerate dehydrogenase [Klebsiella grimontii]